MVYNSRHQDNTFKLSFKADRSTSVSSMRENGPFVMRSVTVQKQANGNRKVVFIKTGERPFRLKTSFRLPTVRYTLIKGTPSSQYQNRRETNDETFKDYFNSRKTEYLSLLLTTDFHNAETVEIESLTNEFLRKKKSVFLNWIQQVFLDNIDTPSIEVGILNLMRLYTYDELSPASQMIALAARDMSDERVRDAAFSLFGHWGDERALKLLEAYNAPADPWMAMKYETLINDIREYALCKGNQ